MNILHLNMLYPPHVLGGAEKSVALLCEALLAAGHEVAASCTTPKGAVREVVNGVRVFRIPHGTDFWAEEWPERNTLQRGLRKLKMPFSGAFERNFGAVIDEVRPQIVHTHSMNDVSTRAWVAAKERGIPIVHTLRDYDLLCANSSLFRNGRPCVTRHLKCRVISAAKAVQHRHIDAVVGVGAGILNMHIEHGMFGHIAPELQRVIWNPSIVTPEVQRTGLERSGPVTFGYLGRISIDKGVGTLLRACRSLPKQGWRLLVAGRSPLEDDPLFKLAEGLPVEFLGFVPSGDFLSNIDALVVPSIWAEPLPRTILEAYAQGVPAIGSRSGGIPDLIGADNNEWLFAPDNDAQLAAIMQRVLKLGRQAMPPRASYDAVLARTTPEAVVEHYTSLYAEVLARVGARA
jgi:glycosyltransferase involved in cell wall biosynthesis